MTPTPATNDVPMQPVAPTGEASARGDRPTTLPAAAIAFAAVRKVFGSVPGQKTGEVEAIREVSGTIHEGEFLVLIGPSGCGKSTLLEIVAGLQKPSGGSVTFHGEEIRSPHRSMSVVFQEESLFPWRTVLGNTEFGLEARRVPKRERRERAMDVIRLVGLAGFEDKYPRQLSGGMRQRVAIARALALDPDVLLMDEPFGALDQQTRYYLGGELLRIWEESKKTVLFVTHDINEAVLLGDRVWVMSHRPSTIKLEAIIDIPRPRSLATLSESRFHELTDELWRALAGDLEGGALR